MPQKKRDLDYDFVVIGSGFGGSVAALRLSEKGYRVLVVEKGKRFTSKDFPQTIWNLRRWLWLPAMRFFGFFKMTYYRHVAILSGVGVGGGSLVYANTLAMPKNDFFRAPSWSALGNWQEELSPYYTLARKMLGSAKNPLPQAADKALESVAKDLGLEQQYQLTDVAVFFGEPDKTVSDPYFGGRGPERSGCNFCGGCMVGCRYNAKNTLDKNYLYLAEQNGVTIAAEQEVVDIVPEGDAGGKDGYRIKLRRSTAWLKGKQWVTSRGVVFSGGVLGTVPLLLRLRKKSLPLLSAKIGFGVRTNSEALVPVTSRQRDKEYSAGVAIGSILHTDAHSHLEPVRYSNGSGIWRLIMAPMVSGGNMIERISKMLADLGRHPRKTMNWLFTDDWAKRTTVLLFMQTLESRLRLRRGWWRMKTSVEEGPAPSAFIPEANQLAQKYAGVVDGKATVGIHETLLGIPSTAHILGGACMGADKQSGVIDSQHRVFGYANMYVCDGAAVSANPGVNPSLTITALSERAMALIPARQRPIER
jgi:cholesterol oxidase